MLLPASLQVVALDWGESPFTKSVQGQMIGADFSLPGSVTGIRMT